MALKMKLSKIIVLLFSLIFFLNCEPLEPKNCVYAEDITTWSFQTNRNVLSVSFPLDGCGRSSKVISELSKDGKFSMFREFIPNIYKDVSAKVEIDSGIKEPCATTSLSLDDQIQDSSIAIFPIISGVYKIGISVTSKEHCLITIKPLIYLN